MFKDRKEAGKKLALKLMNMEFNVENSIVIALPRGGVPVGNEISRKLNISLDTFSVKKIGHPSNPEYALGAVAEDGEYYYNPVSHYKIDVLDELKEESLIKAKNQAELLRGGRPLSNLMGKTVILVDDGIATGSTAEAAISLIKNKNPKSIILAIPVAPVEKINKLKNLVSDVVVLGTPYPFSSVGQWYDSFPQVTNDEVKEILNEYVHLIQLEDVQNHWSLVD